MNIVICDDEEYILNSIKQVCKRSLCNECNITCFLSSSDLKRALLEEQLDVDLFILDIEMPEVDGFELKNMISWVYVNTNIIFLTSHDDMMEKAFGKKVIGFLKKRDYVEELKKLLITVKREVDEDYIITINEGKIQYKLHTSRIFSIISERVYTNVLQVEYYNMDDKEIILKIKAYRILLKEWEEKLEGYGFYRINRSCIVNLRYVKGIKKKVIMDNGESYSIAVGKKKIIKEIYDKYCEERARCL